MQMSYKIGALVWVGIALLTITDAQAQLQSSAAQAETPPAGLEEIVVTAQKRSESLQSVPVSVTVLTASQLDEMKMDTPSAIAAHIPNLQVNDVNGGASPVFSLRGVSMFDYSFTQASPVASYIDEVYKGNTMLFGVEMYDLERIEVLRGPQGTLYGKNTTGGAINFITVKPGFDTEGYFKLGYGNYNREEAEGAFQTALIPEKIAIRAAFTYTKANGFVDNVLPGYPDLEGVDQYGVRLSVLFRINDDASATLRLSKSRQNPQNYAIIDGGIAAPNAAAGSPGGVGFTGYFRTQDGSFTGTPLNNEQIGANYTPRRQQDNEAIESTIDWKVSNALSITSITSLDVGSLFIPENTDGAPFDIYKIATSGSNHQFTQDLRLTSSTGGPLDYIVGAYYQHAIINSSVQNQAYNFLDVNGDGVLNYQDCVDSSFAPAGAGVGYASGAVLNPACRYYNFFEQTTNTWAAYSDASYRVAPIVKLRAGLRYNHDNGGQKNALDQLQGSDNVPIANLGSFTAQPGGYSAPTLALPGSPNYSALVDATRSQYLHNVATTGHVGVDVTPSSDSLLYISYSRGYRSAAFNAQFLFTPTDFTTVQPETLDSIEAGFKTSWLDNHLQLDGAIFHYQYKNQQIVDVEPSGQQPLINLEKSRIYGGELELIARPTRDLTVRGGLGLLNAKVQQGSVQGGTIDVAGHTLPDAPSVSATVADDWDFLHFNTSKLTLHLDASYASKQYFELVNIERLAQNPYALANGRLAYHSAADKWEVGTWVNNIFDKFYQTDAYDLQLLGFDYRHRDTPRMFGIDASYRF
jgi:iron complex outermembrane recepter protein